MRILLTNDDGFQAQGIKDLETIANALAGGPHDVWVVAPSEDKSATSHALTVGQSLRLKRYDDRHFSLTGTPADCAAFAIKELMKDHKPDVVLSGINNGWNLGDDVLYSGTVGAAMEAVLHGINAIALSAVGDYERKHPMPKEVATALLNQLLSQQSSALPLFLNINFPDAAQDNIKGIAITNQAKQNHRGKDSPTVTRYEKFIDPRGFTHYWTGFTGYDPNTISGTDQAAMHDHMISITPLHYNLTDQATKKSLSETITWPLV